MKRVLGVDGALPGAVRQKCATCDEEKQHKLIYNSTAITKQQQTRS